MITLLFDAAQLGMGIAVAAAIGFLFLFIAIAFVTFKLLKRTVKIAMRLVIAGLIVAVAITGSVLLYSYGTSNPTRSKPRPAATR